MVATAPRRKKTPQARPLLGELKIDRMLCTLIRCPDAFEVARTTLKPEHFTPAEYVLGVIWASTLECHAANAELPDMRRLLAEIADKLEHDQTWDETNESRLKELLSMAFERKAKWNAEEGLQLLRLFLQERLAASVPDSLFPGLGVVADVAGTMAAIAAEAANYQTIGRPRAASFAEDLTYEDRLAPLRGREFLGLKTGKRQFDCRTCGLSGVTLLVGGTGSCKTLTAGSLCHGVLSEHTANNACVVFLTLEMTCDNIKGRFFADFSGLDKTKWERGSVPGLFLPDVNSYFTENDQALIEEGRRKQRDPLIGGRLLIHDASTLGSISAEAIARVVLDFKQATGASRALVVVDYLQKLPVPADCANDAQAAANYRAQMLLDIRRLTADGDDPSGAAIIAICQKRKDSGARSEKTVDEFNESIMGSATTGYDAAAIIVLEKAADKQIMSAYGCAGIAEAKRTRSRLFAANIAPIRATLSKGRDGTHLGSWWCECDFELYRYREDRTFADRRDCFPDADASNEAADGTGEQLRIPLPAQLARAPGGDRSLPAMFWASGDDDDGDCNPDDASDD